MSSLLIFEWRIENYGRQAWTRFMFVTWHLLSSSLEGPPESWEVEGQGACRTPYILSQRIANPVIILLAPIDFQSFRRPCSGVSRQSLRWFFRQHLIIVGGQKVHWHHTDFRISMILLIISLFFLSVENSILSIDFWTSALEVAKSQN